MSLKRAVLTIALMAVATMAEAQSAAAASANYADNEPQKAEPNAQVPATPQANNPPNANGAGSTLGQPDPAANAALQGRIQNSLRDEPTLSASHITVNVTDSTIELSGTAASSKDKETAARIAESFDGNRKFVDKLTVTGQAPPGNDPTKPSTNVSNR